ncbi:protein-tyrosine phosphatase family protein [Hoyosella sp. YIM 151337]|nr:protein-tyrosine phosphatase family protein [Hoyosella sp. YIM 151337]
MCFTWRRPPQVRQRCMWVRWPDFWVPSDPSEAVRQLRSAHSLLATERVELCCGAGVGRTGTGLAALAVIDGMTPDDAVEFIHRTYHLRAVETPWQRKFLSRVLMIS